ncbi:hypothetical protein L7F22_067872 [Adiantum nelumboides]|nr:hypothetical protein [Adiantum nelumboides]
MLHENIEIYDFIIVGGGSAGCLLASRLSQQFPSKQILILEAGKYVQDDEKILCPGLSVSLQGNSQYDWQYSSLPEESLNNRKIKHPRGKVVGGTSAINSHSIVYPNCEWQDRIAEHLLQESQQKKEWNANGMKDAYQRWSTLGNEEERVKTSFPKQLDILQTTWLDIFKELSYSTGTSCFANSEVQAVTITNAIDSSRGERSHAGKAFLEPGLQQQRKNIFLQTGIEVDKILFTEKFNEKLKATSISYSQKGEEHLISGREIILCAGAFGSPAILERSGIGCKSILQAAKIPILYNLSCVGENLQDHLNCSLSFEVQDRISTRDEAIRDPESRKTALKEWQQNRTGRMSEGAAYSFAFTPLQMLETKEETKELFDLVKIVLAAETNPTLQAQYAILQKTIQSPNEATATTLLVRCQRNCDLDSMPPNTPSLVDGNFVTLIAMLAHPFSRGSCHISSNNPSHLPEIKFNYLSHPLDSEILGRHMRLIERLIQSQAFHDILKPEGKRLPRSFPKPITTLEEAKAILPINSATNYHPCGTCSMMKEEIGGVVNERLKVYGTENVRIVDASILPIIPRGNILTAVYAWAEKAAEIIIAESKCAIQEKVY